jgi:hypothetical protein
LNENAVLYALSTLAQTCAALAAFVGAVGLFRLQSLREGQQRAEDTLRDAIATDITRAKAHSIPRAEVIQRAERIVTNQVTGVGAGVPETVEQAVAAWTRFGQPIRRVSATFIVFEAWNLAVILVSLGSFAHVRALIFRSWTMPAAWIIAIVTAVISGVSVFVWLERE